MHILHAILNLLAALLRVIAFAIVGLDLNYRIRM